MRVLVLTPYPYGTVAGPRSSFELWERVLAEAGITLDYAVFETDRLHEVIYTPGHTAEKVWQMALSYRGMIAKSRGARDYDAVLVNREAALIGPAVIERWVARHTPILYLLDDPLYVPYRSPANGLLSYLKAFGKVKTLCRMARVVLANSPHHVEFARQYNANVWEIPSVVDADVYTGWQPRAEQGPVRVGWSGSPSTVPNLQLIKAPLEQVAARDDVALRFIGADDVGLGGIPHHAQAWKADTEVADLRMLDVGLAPLPETPWTKRKFILKLVQYMALGIPPIATPLGANPAVIDDGVTGLLADGDAAWVAAIERLVDNAALREEMGRRAAQVAHERYTLQANAEKIVAAFRSAVA
jgi:glycosyltransferase involved in cell wall biosynthesis